MNRRRWKPVAAGAAVAVMLAVASIGTTSASTVPDSTVPDSTAPAGSGLSDVDLSPQPLPERTTLVVVTAAMLEFAAPLILADEFGEFEKENLDVDVQVSQTSIASLSTGDVDAAWSAPAADFVNAVNSGLELRWVAGNYTVDPASRSGLWMRRDVVGDPPDINALAGTTTTNSQVGGVVTYFIDQLLQGSDTSITELNFEKLSPADTLAALQNGALDGAWLIDPLYRQVEDDPNMIFVGGQPVGEVGGGLIAGPTMIDPANREVSLAFMRALMRTVDTYLQPGYKDDPEVVEALARLGGMDEEVVTSSDELLFDFTIADGLITRMQETWDTLGLLESDGPLPEDQLVDRSLVDEIMAGSA